MKIKGSLILVVDDQPANLKVLFSLLKEHGYQVRIAESGTWALDILDDYQPDLILLDVILPEMDGFEVCRRIKKREKSADIPVIFMTALDRVEDKIAGFEAGGVDYITKPFQQVEVLVRLKFHLELSKMKKNLEEQVLRRTASLEESNIALKVLLEHRNSDQEKLEEKVISQIGSLVTPYLERLKKAGLDNKQRSLIDVIEFNLKEITSRFSGTLYSKTLSLTRREMEIASLIRSSRTNLEISDILNISECAVSFHRQNLRKKLGLLGKKVNLVAYLNETNIK